MQPAVVRRTLAVALAALLSAGPLRAAEPPPSDDYAELRRELRIGADVLRAALRDALPGSLRIVDLEAGYLAGQGALVIVDLASPWFRMDGAEVNPEVTSLEEIPDMVHEILTELDLGLSRHEVRELQALREIRDAQRAVRAEQRALRARLRELGRQRQRAGDDRAGALDQEIAALEAQLAAAAEEERALERDATAVRETLDPGDRQGAQGPSSDTDVARAVAQSVCGYGALFRSLDTGERLNVLLRRGDRSRYFVFDMAAVRACQTGDATAERLLAEAARYEL